MRGDIICFTNRYPLALRQEISLKVERHSMLGLRARDPDMRRKFFLLYHESLGKNLFARLQYIIQNQDWEAMSDVFWLKQGLDLLLAILIEEKPITLAPNSARVVPLLPSQNPGAQHQPPAMPEGPEEVASMFDSIVMKHTQFLSAASKLQVIANYLITLLRRHGAFFCPVKSKIVTNYIRLFGVLSAGSWINLNR